VVPKSSLDKASAALKSAQARVQSAEAAVAKAREQLGYTRVRAPYSGILVERHVEPGEAVGVGAPLVAGISLEKLRSSPSPTRAATASCCGSSCRKGIMTCCRACS